jgi:hypothetical protein
MGRRIDYRNVKKSPAHLEEFLKLSGGRREVPLIVDESEVTTGYGGS